MSTNTKLPLRKQIYIKLFTSLFCFLSFTMLQAQITINGSPLETSIASNTATPIAPSLAITANGSITDFTVSIIDSYDGSDQLSYAGTLPTGVTVVPWNTTTRSIVFEGTSSAAEWQTFLRTITITSGSVCAPETRKVSFAAGETYYNPLNEHFYRLTTTQSSWTNSNNTASSTSYYGREGYLVTLTSEAENTFVTRLVGQNSWMGASDDYIEINNALGYTAYANQSAAEGKFYWVTGPEKGTQLTTANGNGNQIPNVYHNWGNGEPNNAGTEHYGHVYASTKFWNDFPNTQTIYGILEFGDMPNDVTVSAPQFTKNIFIQGSSSGSISGGDVTVCSGTNSTSLTLNGLTGSVVRWESSTDNFITAGTPIANTSTSLTVSNITETTYYRAVVNATAPSSCNGLVTSSTPINVSNPQPGNVFAENTTICAGADVELYVSGQEGTVQKWQRSTDNSSWSDIANTTTSLTETVASIGTVYYRVQVEITGCGAPVASPSKQITVVSGTAPVGGQVSSAAHGTVTNSGTLTLSGNTGTITKWQQSTDNGIIWTDIANTTTTHNYTNITSTTLFRAQLTNGSCGSTFSDEGVVTISLQSPGGVSTNMQLWLKADAGFTYNNLTNAEWLDQSANNLVLNANLVQGLDSDSAPNSNNNVLNFNPGIVFDGVDNGLATAVDAADFDFSEVTVFSVQQVLTDNTNGSKTIWHYDVDGNNDLALFVNPDDYKYQVYFNDALKIDFGNNPLPVLDNRLPHLTGVTTNASSSELYVNNQQIKTSTEGMATLPGNGAILIGLDADAAEAEDGDNHLEGVIGEVLMFDTKLSATDRLQVQSYLALKYGISIDQTTATNYLASDGTTFFWEASQNTGYSNDIFGIGHDNLSGLNQKISKSVNTGTILTLALDADFTTANNDVLRTTTHTNDKQFLMIANNGGATTTQTTEIDNNEFNTRITREWKVDKTANFTQNVNLKFTGFDETWELVKDSDGDFSANIVTVGALNADGEITNITLADGEYLTLAKIVAVTPSIAGFTPIFAGNGDEVTITGTGFLGTTTVAFGVTNASSFTIVSDTEITATVGTGSSGSITVTTPAGNDAELGFIYKVAQYNFENNALDETDNNHDGTEINTVTYDTGAQGQAICFDDDAGYVTLPDNLIRNLSEFTISLRFKTSGTGAILGYQANAPLVDGGNYIPILLVTDDGKLKGTLWTTTNISIQAISESPVNDGNWHQVDFVGDTNSVAIYLDGNLEESQSGAAVAHLDMSKNQLGLAQTNGYNNGTTSWEYFTGCLDDMVIIDRALTAQELQDITALPEPTITSFTPTEVGEQDTVVITGTDFDGATQVTFGGDDALSYTVDSSMQITAIVNTGASGDVTVTTAGGTATANGFTYYEPTYSVSETALTIAEDASTGTFTVVLDIEPKADVVFDVSSNDTDEATVSSVQLTFMPTNWNTPQTITVTGVNDDIDRDDSATITIAVNDAGSDDTFDALADQTVTITLTDDDSAGFTTSETALTIAENIGTDTFTIVLDSEPTSDVVFDISSDDTNEATVSAAQLTFTAANWDAPQTITVTGVNDAIATNDTATITISVNDALSDDTFDTLADKTVAITLTNDDADFTINTIADTNVDENSAYSSVIPNLTGDTPIDNITYTLSGTDATDFTINSATGQVSMVARDFEAPQDDNTDNVYELTITATDDNSNADSEDWTVTVNDIVETVSFDIDAIADANVTENTVYTSVTPNISGSPIGNVTYTLSGNDATDFTINQVTGQVSMVARDFEAPEDDNTDNVYELTITATDDDNNTDSEDWTVTVDDDGGIDVLTQIGLEADAPDIVNSVVTVVQLYTILPALTDVIPGNEAAYQDYIDANPELFSSPATQAEVQAMITIVNATLSNTDVNTLTFSMYPNPAHDVVNFNFTQNGSIAIKVYSVLGKLVMAQHKEIQNNKASINVSSLSKGVYFINIKKDDIENTLKLVVK